MKRIGIGALALVGMLVLASRPAQAQQINTTGSWNGTDFVFPFGLPDTRLYGQTFQAPAQYLTDFTFYLSNNSGGGGLLFDAYVGTWTGTQVGSVLWSSSGSFNGTGGAPFVPYNFNVGSLSLLTGGQTYVAYLFASGGSGLEQVGAPRPDSYADGAFVYQNGSDPTGTAWSTFAPRDVAFIANFSRTAPNGTVPEPASLTLLATGLVAMTGAGRRRWRKADS